MAAVQYGIVAVVVLLVAAVFNLWVSEDSARAARSRRRRKVVAGVLAGLAVLTILVLYLLPALGFPSLSAM